MYVSYILFYLTWPVLIVVSLFLIRWAVRKMEVKWAGSDSEANGGSAG